MADPEQCTRDSVSVKPKESTRLRGEEFSHFKAFMLDDEGNVRQVGGRKVTVKEYMKHRRPNPGPRAQSSRSVVFKTCKSTLYDWMKRLKAMSAAQRLRSVQPKAGRPYSMPRELDISLKNRIQSLVDRGDVVTRSQVRLESLYVALVPLPGESDETILSRFRRVAGKDYIRTFLQFYGFKTIKTGRPVEVERAMKYQPELILQWFRLLMHAHAVCQIQRALVDDPSLDIGWVMPADSTVVRCATQTADPGPDVLAVRDGVYWVVPLNKPLEYVASNRIWNYDEKPIVLHNPDRRVSRVCRENNLIPICMPSHLSTLLQPLDNGVNHAYNKSYQKIYTGFVTCHQTQLPSAASIVQMACEAYASIQKSTVWSSCWASVGQKEGIPNIEYFDVEVSFLC